VDEEQREQRRDDRKLGRDQERAPADAIGEQSGSGGEQPRQRVGKEDQPGLGAGAR
jgi:hypothetical protein